MNGFLNPTKPTCKSSECQHLHLTEFLFETYSAEHSQDDKFVGFQILFVKYFFLFCISGLVLPVLFSLFCKNHRSQTTGILGENCYTHFLSVICPTPFFVVDYIISVMIFNFTSVTQLFC